MTMAMAPLTRFSDTIAAIASPLGRGGVGVIRISGPDVPSIATQLLESLPSPRQAKLSQFRDHKGQILDKGLAIYFPGPHSYTGEDVLELQGHGGPVIMDIVLAAVLGYGARLAAPGEFSQRAFLNDKMDLAQAEAVADLIDASTKQAALSATRSLQGDFSRKINTLANQMMELRMYVEAAIDFSEEEVDFLNEGAVLSKIEDCLTSLKALLQATRQGQLLKEGMSVAIVGQPNAGKSSLLNCLTQHETAIVTPIPGTTRDLVKETIQISGLPVHLVDTAGIRLGAEAIEQEGIRRAKEQQALCDRILLIVDVTITPHFSEIEQQMLMEFKDKITIVMNKVDLAKEPVGEREGKFYLSAKTGEGISFLLSHLMQCIGFQNEEASTFIARRRHVDALHKAYTHCLQAKTQLEKFKAGELVAEELRLAQDALGQIVGKITTEDLLGNIFANFCIGK